MSAAPLSSLLDAASADSVLRAAIGKARDGTALAGTARDGGGAVDLAAPAAAQPFVLAALAAAPPLGAGRTVLAVTATDREAGDLAEILVALMPSAAVAEYPAWETLPHERLSPRADTVGRRLAVRRRLKHPEEGAQPLRVVVAPVRALLQPQVAGLGDLEPVTLHVGQQADLDDVVRRLVGAGYSRVDMVEKRGEIAVRGGIVDVFPPTGEHPLRVEFFGDDVEEIRTFSVADQRTTGVADGGLWAPPCRELLLTPSVVARAERLAEQQPQLADILGKVAAGVAVEGMESLAPLLVDRMDLLLDDLPAGTIIVACDPERVRARAAEVVRTGEEFLAAAWAGAAAGSAAPIDIDRAGHGFGAAALRSYADVRARAADLGLPWWSVGPFGGLDGVRELGLHAVDPYRGDVEAVAKDIKGWTSSGWRVAVVAQGAGSARRVAEVLAEADVPVRAAEPDQAAQLEPRVVQVLTGSLAGGFVAPALELAVLTEADVFGRAAQSASSATRAMGRLPSRRRGAIDPLQLQAGDLVVHEHHGVGRYVEMVQRTVQGATREYLVVEYAPSKRGQPGDRLYVPTDQLAQLTRYVGGEQPGLDKLGGSDWARRKGRARKAVREIAGELIRLYSARTAAPGHPFAPDTPWQRELEEAFPYVETPDQLRTIDEVKADMELPVPMDRLICGDVGYGKTEIAVRAAFKAVQDGRQVAILCPTTLLVQQHFATFSERFANFPVVVKPVSRFNTDAEEKATLEGVADGRVDVVIGTHRLIAGKTMFKNLGLIVVDEEQRFGVEHKEKLKQLRTDVDVLAMSATPIPRTLEMAVTGIREMSVIQTPPEERHPILTFVGAYAERQVAAAIHRELLREGQVFFVHNRVSSIDRAAAKLRELVPEARIAVAHGQMHEDALEQVMVDFWERSFDVLVCTTIVEAGLDIPNANTLIVERADLLGLSQLHQLRGRVGRGRERGYAYFLYPAEKPLTETAHDRLATIAQHTDLGAGMAVAMKDLEIRGAGNLLGGEQSGHIAAVGFDLYVRLVGEAVADFKAGIASLDGGGDDEEEPAADAKVDLPVDAHVPHEYVDGERLRLEAYRLIAGIGSADDIDAVRGELTDRYGEPPEPVLNLLEVARLRIALRRHGVGEVAAQGNQIRFAPITLRESQEMRLKRLYPGSVVKAGLRTVLVPRPTTARVGGRPRRDVELLTWCAELLDALAPDTDAARTLERAGSDEAGTHGR